MVDQVGTVQLAPRASLVAAKATFRTGGITLAPRFSLVATAYNGTDVLLAPRSSLTVSKITFVIGGQVEYYVGEASDSVTIYRYVTEDFDIVTNPRYYVATSGIGGGFVLSPLTNLTANAGQRFLTTVASLSGLAGLTVNAGLRQHVTAALAAQSSLTALGNIGATFLFTDGPHLTVSATVAKFVTAVLAAEAVLTAATAPVSHHATADLASETHLSAKSILVPDVIGHSLVYVVTAPNMWELTSDPDIGPLLRDDTYISVYHTVVDSVTPLAGAWRVIVLFPPAPFDINLAASDKCPLIYDVTAITLGEDFEHIVVKNDLGDVADLEIVLDGFADMIMPGMLGK